MANCNGFKLRGLNGDSGKVSVQSNIATTWMLDTHRFGVPKTYDVGITQNELIIIKGQESARPEIEVVPQGANDGTLIAKFSQGATQVLRSGVKYRFQLNQGETLILRGPEMKDPEGNRVAA